MNQDMNMGMMLCMLAGVLFSLVLIVQTILQAKILQGVRRITEKTGPASPQNRPAYEDGMCNLSIRCEMRHRLRSFSVDIQMRSAECGIRNRSLRLISLRGTAGPDNGRAKTSAHLFATLHCGAFPMRRV